MITSVEEYIASLGEINDINYRLEGLFIPRDEFIYDIDLTTRTIKGPEVLGVEKDHIAETIYFLVDRMFCGIDLANASCIIQYVNAKNQGRFYPVPFCDINTFSGRDENKRYVIAHVLYSNYEKDKYYILNDDGQYVKSMEAFDPEQTYYNYIDQPKIAIPWVISGEATAEPGIVEYSIRFYISDTEKKVDNYSLNTQPTKSRVLPGLITTEEQNLQYDTDALSLINQRVDQLAREYQLYWIEA